jgi:murein DD-endopeptidase MepM/ murein hydrolase activator NlpD
MIYGSRQVQAGETVAAGQLIGFVGSTGRSTANHLHFEVHVNGGLMEPIAWLAANAG